MKTHREIVTEAQRLEESARRFADDQRRDATLRDAFSVLFSFPESRFTSRVNGAGGDADEIHTNRRVRRIETALVGDALEYRLVQDEIETTESGTVVKETSPVLMLTTDSALEALEEGYELGEEERLSEMLAPFMDRAEAGEFVDAVEPHVVEELEAIIGAGDLLPASRLHAKTDIVKLLDGRLEPDEFITAAIARQRYCEELHESISEHPRERILVDQP
jgi:hypothetical protein